MTDYLEEKTPTSESLFFQYINVLKKRKGVVLAFAGVLIITAIIATVISTRYYSSQAVIEIMPIAPSIMGNESGDSLTELGASSDSSIRMYYGTQFAILSSDTVLQKAIIRLQDEHEITDFDEIPVASSAISCNDILSIKSTYPAIPLFSAITGVV